MIASDADLTAEVLAEVLPGRPVRAYPAMLSTEADALAWARSGGPSGALVVAGYQASPRGRAGLPWSATPGRSLGFSLLLRPALSPEREGWPYLVAATAAAEVLGGASIVWPDSVRAGHREARTAVQAEVAPDGLRWVVVSCLFAEVLPPRGRLLAAAVKAIESCAAREADEVLTSARERCETLGQRVRARVIPMGPRGVVVEGVAADLAEDGSLVVETPQGRRQRVRPQDLGVLDPG